MTAQIATGRTAFWSSVERVTPMRERAALGQENFRRMIFIERKRAERSGCPFLVMLIDVGNYKAKDNNENRLDTMMAALLLTTRETDIIGWYKDQEIAGTIFTGLESQDKRLILEAILIRVTNALRNNLTCEQFGRVSISFYFFPKEWGRDVPYQLIDSASYYPDLASHHSVGQEALAEHIEVIEQLSTQQPTLQETVARMSDAILAGRKVIRFGNRGNGADAHILPRQPEVAELIRSTSRQPRAVSRQPHPPEMTPALQRDSAYRARPE